MNNERSSSLLVFDIFSHSFNQIYYKNIIKKKKEKHVDLTY
jgi:hypothetical protein